MEKKKRKITFVSSTRIYVSTDSDELEGLVENLDVSFEVSGDLASLLAGVDLITLKGLFYKNVSIEEGEELKKEIGFNPMGCIYFIREPSWREINEIQQNLAKQCLYVSVKNEEGYSVPEVDDTKRLFLNKALTQEIYLSFEKTFALLIMSNIGEYREPDRESMEEFYRHIRPYISNIN